MDAFYVTVELQRRPELRGKPSSSPAPARARSSPPPATRRASSASSPPPRPSALAGSARTRSSSRRTSSLPRTSREVMAVLREHIERVEVVGLDEAYLDLTGIERPKAAARRVKAAVTRAHRARLLDRHGAVQARGQGRLGRREAGRLLVLSREQACERFAGVATGPDPRHRPAHGRAPGALGIRTLGELAAAPGTPCSPMVRRATRPVPRALARFEDDRAVTTDRRQVRVARDDLRLRPARTRRAPAPSSTG